MMELNVYDFCFSYVPIFLSSFAAKDWIWKEAGTEIPIFDGFWRFFVDKCPAVACSQHMENQGKMVMRHASKVRQKVMELMVG